LSYKSKFHILEKIRLASSLSVEEYVKLYDPTLIHELGAIANEIAISKHGEIAYYVLNRHINPTNLCVNRCKFCAFSRSKGQAGAFELTIEEIIDKLTSSQIPFTELHIVGGLHPDWKFEHYLNIIKVVRLHFPNIAIKAYSAVEIDYMSKIAGMDIDHVIKSLKDAGLDMLPGGGAEIFESKVRDKLCPEKISGERWLYIMQRAHINGILSNATMLYGHIENYIDRVNHMLKIRELQDKTGGFQAFIPLSYQPINTEIGGKWTSGIDDLLNIAISRIILDNVPHIKAYWIMLGEKISQTALLFGADDLDGTIIEEKISHSAGASSSQSMTEDDLQWLIKKAGKKPVQRDGFYRIVE